MKLFIILTLLQLSFVSLLYSKIHIKKLIKLNNPWSIAFMDNSKILITEKLGKIKLYDLNNNTLVNIPHNLKVYSKGQGGLLDIICEDNIIWVSYSEKLNNSLSTTSIAKAKFKKQKLIFKNIFQSTPPINSQYHYGSRLAIKDRYLYATIGERGKGMIAQDPTKHPGSIIRIFKNGLIPNENPYFINKNNWLPEIYQIGVRNPQGLELSPYDNQIYTTNHGAMGGDFIGKVFYGGNYGWKELGWGGKNYIGTEIGPKWKKGYNKAIYYWTPSIGISSFIIYKGKEFPEWNGSAIIGSLKYKTLYKINLLEKKEYPEVNVIVKNSLGRIRDLEIHPLNGKIYTVNRKFLWLIEKKINH